MEISLADFYKGKSILITGSTGFLGKILLYRFLTLFPDLKHIYLLLRQKSRSTVEERLRKEIYDSLCFDQVKQLNNNFGSLFFEKVIPIRGDLTKLNLGIQPKSLELLQNEVNIIVHCAVLIDYTFTFVNHVDVNVIGSLRLFEVSKQFKNLVNFVHLSTAYVNSPDSQILENALQLNINAERVLAEVKANNELTPKMNKFGDQKRLKQHLFSKALADILLTQRNKEAGNQNGKQQTLTILRPAILGASWRYPMQGFIDELNVGGALILSVGSGVLKIIEGSQKNLTDLVPVDLVADYCIAAGCYFSNSLKTNFMNVAMGGESQLTWRQLLHPIVRYFTDHPVPNQVSKPSLSLYQSQFKIKSYRNLRRMPIEVLKKVAKGLGMTKCQRKYQKYLDFLDKAKDYSEEFSHFFKNEWIFKTERMKEIQGASGMELLNLDQRKIEWDHYLQSYCYGLQKYVLKLVIEPPGKKDGRDLLQKQKFSQEWFQDLKFAYKAEFKQNLRPFEEMKKLILESDPVRKKMIELSQREENVKNSNSQFISVAQKKSGADICKFLFSQKSAKIMRVFSWFLNKGFKKIYKKVIINEEKFNRIKELQTKNKPMIFLPTHKSYIDFLIMSYVLFFFGINPPYVAAAEDFLNMVVVWRLLSGGGAFFLRRKSRYNDELYKVILKEYIQRLLIDGNGLEFFIEGTRSRTGKLLSPKFGLLKYVSDAYFTKKVEDVYLLPITINYEKILEGHTYPRELLGLPKVKESLSRLIKATSIIFENYGRIFIDCHEPISLKAYINNQLELCKAQGKLLNPFKDNEARKFLLNKLGYEIVYSLNKNLVIMPTAIVATILLLHRKGISEDLIVQQTTWLANDLLKRGIKIGSINETSQSSGQIAVRQALEHLSHMIFRKGNIFQLSLTVKSDWQNVLLLCYYRNTMIQFYWHEAQIACAFYSFGKEMMTKNGVDKERLFQETQFLANVLEREYIIENKMMREDEFEKKLVLLEKLKIIEVSEGKVFLRDRFYLSFLCSLIWPFAESYWVTILYIISLKKSNRKMTLYTLYMSVQWFAETLYEERVIPHFESCSLDTIKNSLAKLAQMKIIKFIGKGKDCGIKILSSIEELIDLRNNMNQFLKVPVTKAALQPQKIRHITEVLEDPTPNL